MEKQTQSCHVAVTSDVYKVVSKIFRTDSVKIVKLTIRPIGRRHPRSCSLPHVGHRSHRLLHFWNASWESFCIRVSSPLCDSYLEKFIFKNNLPYFFEPCVIAIFAAEFLILFNPYPANAENMASS